MSFRGLREGLPGGEGGVEMMGIKCLCMKFQNKKNKIEKQANKPKIYIVWISQRTNDNI